MFTLKTLEELVKSARDKGFDDNDIILVVRENTSHPVGKIIDGYITNEKLYIEYGAL